MAEALKVNAVLKNLDTRANNISGAVAQELAAAAFESKSLEVFSLMPIKELREDKLTELNLSDKTLGPPEGILLSMLVKVSAVLNKLDVRYNNLGDEGKRALQESAEGREGFELM